MNSCTLRAQDGDLDVLGVLASLAPEQHADEPACHEEGQSIGRLSPTPDPGCSVDAAGFLNPTRILTGVIRETMLRGELTDPTRPRGQLLARGSGVTEGTVR
jgi:hypothetical protein